MSELAPVLICLGVFYATYKIFELFVRRKERMAMIEKMSLKDGCVIPPDISQWFSPPSPSSWALRGGLLLAGLGLGLIVAFVMNYNMNPDDRGILYAASMLFFGGTGLVIAYLIEQKQKK